MFVWLGLLILFTLINFKGDTVYLDGIKSVNDENLELDENEIEKAFNSVLDDPCNILIFWIIKNSLSKFR